MESVIGSSRTGIAAVCLVLLLFAPCSHAEGRASVGIVYRGGPAPGNSNVLRAGTIRIFGSDGSLMASGHVEEGATFEASLRPGTYRVEGRSGDAQCMDRAITIRGASEAAVHIPCSLR
jgi:hypothetical protein